VNQGLSFDRLYMMPGPVIRKAYDLTGLDLILNRRYQAGRKLVFLNLHESKLPDTRIGCKRKQSLLEIIVVDAQETLAIGFTCKV
jgi:hypothetical protein